MVRVKIPHSPGAFYHVTLRGNRKQKVFLDDADYRLFEWLIRDAAQRFAVEVHAFCWMPNHVHMLIRVDAAPVCRFVQHFASRYARRFNQSHETVGHLFQGRYWAGVIDTDAYLLSTLRYIHRNPVAAGLADTASEFPWSSHRTYIGTASRDWLTTRFVLTLFAENPSDAFVPFAAFVDEQTECAKDALSALIREAELNFDVSAQELASDSRHDSAVLARAWIAYQGMRVLGLTLEDISTRIGRSPRALSDGITARLAEIRQSPPAASALLRG